MARILIPNYEFVENWSEDQMSLLMSLQAYQLD